MERILCPNCGKPFIPWKLKKCPHCHRRLPRFISYIRVLSDSPKLHPDPIKRREAELAQRYFGLAKGIPENDLLPRFYPDAESLHDLVLPRTAREINHNTTLPVRFPPNLSRRTADRLVSTGVHERILDRPTDFGLKIILLGSNDTGKTGLLLRYTQKVYSPEYKQSLGASFAVKDLQIDNRMVKVVIWDVAGQPSFRQARKHYYSGAHGALLIFDVTNPATFMTTHDWIEEFRQAVPQGALVLVGNRTDPQKDRCVPMQVGKMIERRWGTPYIETDIATGKGVDEAFSKVVSLALGRVVSYANQQPQILGGGERWRRGGVGGVGVIHE
ncbi:MAG: Rab family GTPase [Candidatus Hodarchaeota archaeon]